MSNMKTVHEIYGAFARGDLPGILKQLADSVEWEYGSTASSASWLDRRTGVDGAQAGLIATFSSMDVKSFVPKAFIEGDGVVVVLFDTEFVVKSTGKTVKEVDAVHIWRFDAEGKVSQFRHRVDTLQQHNAASAS